MDLLQRGKEDDILDGKVWQSILEKLAAGEYDILLVSPPCNTFSRAVWANNAGPKPLRSRLYPWGFPWLQGTKRNKCVAANTLIDRSIEAITAASRSSAHTRFWMEHPEDLGITHNGGSPASVWQLEDLQLLAQELSASTVAFFQCQFEGVDYAKPTRTLSSLYEHHKFGRQGWPSFEASGRYAGPLPRFCGHRHSTPMIGRSADGASFNITSTATYPANMCAAIARLVFRDFWRRLRDAGSHAVVDTAPQACNPSVESHGTSGQVNDEVRPPPSFEVSRSGAWSSVTGHVSADTREGAGAPAESSVDAGSLGVTCMASGSASSGDLEADEAATSDEDEDGVHRPKLGAGIWGNGPPLRVKCAGRARDFHDGAGLCSPLRWPPPYRNIDTSGLSKDLRDGFIKLLDSAIDVKRLLFTLACGKVKNNPFPDSLITEGRRLWFDILEKYSRGPKPSEYPAEGQPIYLEGLQTQLCLSGDPDHRILTKGTHNFAEGVQLGDTVRMPRTPAVFERKVKWRSYEEEMDGREPESRENYRSTVGHLEELEGQFQSEGETGNDEGNHRSRGQGPFMVMICGLPLWGQSKSRIAVSVSFLTPPMASK